MQCINKVNMYQRFVLYIWELGLLDRGGPERLMTPLLVAIATCLVATVGLLCLSELVLSSGDFFAV